MILINNNKFTESRERISRRQVLGIGLAVTAAALIPESIFAAARDLSPEREISFYNLHTHETLDVVYWKDGLYDPEALSRINHIFRDSRTGKEKVINAGLLDLLSSIRQKLKSKEPFHLYSGYRTPRSNAILRRQNKGASKNSLHMYGKAVDLRLPGHSLKVLRKAAMSFRQGGVGYYPRSKFVHIDVGSVRYWWG